MYIYTVILQFPISLGSHVRRAARRGSHGRAPPGPWSLVHLPDPWHLLPTGSSGRHAASKPNATQKAGTKRRLPVSLPANSAATAALTEAQRQLEVVARTGALLMLVAKHLCHRWSIESVWSHIWFIQDWQTEYR